MPSSGFLSGTIPLFLNHDCTPPAEGTYSVGRDGIVLAGDAESAIRKCNSGNGYRNTVRPLSSAGMWSCNPKSSSGRSGSGGSGSDGGRYSRRSIAPQQLPLADVHVSAELGINSGIQFQRFNHYAVGIQSVADMGILDVVDVWGNASQYFEVCFPQSGQIVFLDAFSGDFTANAVVSVSNFSTDGYACAAMNRPGTMVLVEGSTQLVHSNVALAQSFIDSTTTDRVSSAIDLEDCTVTPSHKLNLREDPWGEKLDVVPQATTLSATARTKSWFKVSYTSADVEASEGEGTQAVEIEGWIAAWLSEVDGDCDWESDDDDDSPALASTGFPAQNERLSIA